MHYENHTEKKDTMNCILRPADPPSGAAAMSQSSECLPQSFAFTSCGSSSSSDGSSDEWEPCSAPFLRSPMQQHLSQACRRSPRSPIMQHLSQACRTPRAQRVRSIGLPQSPSFSSSAIPYAALNKLTLCESPNTPKVVKYGSTMSIHV